MSHEIKEKCIDEMRKYYVKEVASIDILSKLEFLTGCIKETLRLFSPVQKMHTTSALENCRVGPVDILKGTYVTVDTCPNAHSKFFFENPEAFIPERWIKTTLKDPTSFIPFFTGARNCLGQHAAMLHAKIILCELLLGFDFELPKGFKLDLTQEAFVEPKSNIVLNLKPLW